MSFRAKAFLGLLLLLTCAPTQAEDDGPQGEPAAPQGMPGVPLKDQIAATNAITEQRRAEQLQSEGAASVRNHSIRLQDYPAESAARIVCEQYDANLRQNVMLEWAISNEGVPGPDGQIVQGRPMAIHCPTVYKTFNMEAPGLIKMFGSDGPPVSTSANYPDLARRCLNPTAAPGTDQLASAVGQTAAVSAVDQEKECEKATRRSLELQKTKPADGILDIAGDCILQIFKGLVLNVRDLVTSVWEGLKWLGGKLIPSTTPVDNAAADKSQFASTLTNEQLADIKNNASVIPGWLKEFWYTTYNYISTDLGKEFLSLGGEPFVCFGALNARQKTNYVCGIVSYLVGGGVSFLGKGSSAILSFLKTKLPKLAKAGSALKATKIGSAVSKYANITLTGILPTLASGSAVPLIIGPIQKALTGLLGKTKLFSRYNGGLVYGPINKLVNNTRLGNVRGFRWLKDKPLPAAAPGMKPKGDGPDGPEGPAKGTDGPEGPTNPSGDGPDGPSKPTADGPAEPPSSANVDTAQPAQPAQPARPGKPTKPVTETTESLGLGDQAAPSSRRDSSRRVRILKDGDVVTRQKNADGSTNLKVESGSDLIERTGNKLDGYTVDRMRGGAFKQEKTLTNRIASETVTTDPKTGVRSTTTTYADGRIVDRVPNVEGGYNFTELRGGRAESWSTNKAGKRLPSDQMVEARKPAPAELEAPAPAQAQTQGAPAPEAPAPISQISEPLQPQRPLEQRPTPKNPLENARRVRASDFDPKTRYDYKARKVSVQEGRIIENTPASNLKPGRYRFVLRPDGTAVYGVRGPDGLAPSAVQLAGRGPVVAGGVLEVLPGGGANFDIKYSVVTKAAVSPSGRVKLEGRVADFFEKEFNTTVGRSIERRPASKSPAKTRSKPPTATETELLQTEVRPDRGSQIPQSQRQTLFEGVDATTLRPGNYNFVVLEGATTPIYGKTSIAELAKGRPLASKGVVEVSDGGKVKYAVYGGKEWKDLPPRQNGAAAPKEAAPVQPDRVNSPTAKAERSYPNAALTKPGEAPFSFDGVPINQISAPNGARVVRKFYTAQGSEYILTADGQSRRIKSPHRNTGGEDAGLHPWNDKAIFLEGAAGEFFNNTMGMLGGKFEGKPVQVTRTNGVARLQVQENGIWRDLTNSDVYPRSVKTGRLKPDSPITANYSDEPAVGYSILEIKIDAQGNQRVHPGSPVSHIEPTSPVSGNVPDQPKAAPAPVVAPVSVAPPAPAVAPAPVVAPAPAPVAVPAPAPATPKNIPINREGKVLRNNIRKTFGSPEKGVEPPRSVEIQGTRDFIDGSAQVRDKTWVTRAGDRTMVPTGNIFEGVRGRTFQPGREYNFVVLQDGRTVFGLIENKMQVGVRDFNLANGQNVISGGRIRVSADGKTIEMNTGSQLAKKVSDPTRDTARDYNTPAPDSNPTGKTLDLSEERLLQQSRNALQEIVGPDIKVNEVKNLGLKAPKATREDLLRYCQFPTWRAANPALCP